MRINLFDYISDTMIGSSLFMIDDYIGCNLVYEYKFNGEYYHTHDFISLLRYIVSDIESAVIHEDAEDFEFSIEEFKDQYSEQEIILIERLVTALKRDIPLYKELREMK